MTDSTKYPVAADARCCAGTLCLPVPPIAPELPVAEALKLLTAEPELVAIPVVRDDGVPIGLVNRKQLIEHFARPYTRELFGRKTVTAFMDLHPLIVDARTDLDDLSSIISESDMRYMYEGFIITRDGRYAGLGTGHDLMRAITRRKQEHFHRLAHFDPLTGLPNRLLFVDRLHQVLTQAHRAERMAAVMLLDLDRFKTVNDSLGHAAGDQLLKAVAERLSGCIREGDTVARLGGDEFSLLLPDLRYIQDGATVAQKILDVLTQPFRLNGHELFLSTSIGITLYPFEESSDALLRQADAAMYAAKRRGGKCFEFYTAEMGAASVKRLSLEGALRRALEREELVLHYQPQIDLPSGTVVGAEALLRWRHPEWGLVAPSEFIPLAEETGLIVPLGQWVLEQACRQAVAWRNAGLAPGRIAVNVSARQFHQSDFAATILETLERTGLEPRRLELELTESALMGNLEATAAMLETLHHAGVQIAIDDFGTGYSSLGYLKRFPIDRIKIDRSFIRDIPADADDAALAAAIIALCRNLAIEAVAEGVETAEQLEFLRERGCHSVQGFLLSPPLPTAGLAEWLTAAGKNCGCQRLGLLQGCLAFDSLPGER
jgi:diguanylate cyclase (GGDEF)-like protein